MNNNDQTEIQNAKSSMLNEFLWTCAGVNKAVLRQCPSDYAKYAGIGGTILFTALMAMLSGGYAMGFVFKDTPLAIAFGIFWGLLIFNLDRFIVNTMYSDGKHTISWGELGSGMPRIIMAIFLGLVISTPLELKIFEDSIKMRIEEEKKNILEQRLEYLTGDLQKVEDEIVAIQQGVGDTYSDDIHTGNKMIDDLSDSINQTQPKLNAVQNELTSLISQKTKLDRKAEDYVQRKNAIEAKTRPLYAKRAALSSKLKKWRSERSGMQTTVGTMTTTQSDDKRQSLLKLNAERDSIKHLIADSRVYHMSYTPNDVRLKGSVFDKINLEYSGFNSELKAFHDIRNEDASTNTAAWFVMLLFVIIETAPTFFKMMMEDGPYDDLLRAEKHRVKVLSQKRISDINDDVNTSVRISTMKNEKRLEAETIANQDILEKVARAQAELLEKAINEWKAIELEKIQRNPSDYVVSLVPSAREMEVSIDAEGNLSESGHHQTLNESNPDASESNDESSNNNGNQTTHQS